MDELNFNPEAKELLQEASEIFTDSSEKIIFDKITSLRLKIENIIKILEIAIGNGGQRTQARKNLTNILKTSYQLIMEVRTLLLGTSEAIQYRLYIREGNILKVFDVTEAKLIEIVERSGDNLRLRRNFSQIEASYQNQSMANYIDAHFSNIYNSFDPPGKNKQGYTVQMSVIGQYGDPPNLVWPIDINGKGKSWRTPKIFNLGWIYQAFDATVYDLYNYQHNEMIQQITNNEFHRSYFVDHLKYDNLVGFKGGDVGLNQIKGNMASLMNAKTILKYLGYIRDILTPQYFENKTALISFIQNNFLDTSKDIGPELSKYVSKQADQLLKILGIKNI